MGIYTLAACTCTVNKGMNRPKGKRDSWTSPDFKYCSFSIGRNVMQHPEDPFEAYIRFKRGYSGQLLDIGPNVVLDLYDARGRFMMAKVQQADIEKSGRTG